MRKLTIIAFLSMFLAFFACEEINDEVLISKSNSFESHNNGFNCMDCHYEEGSGEGIFTLAGTVSGNIDLSGVNVYDASNGSQLASIAVDGYGNFYTTEDIDFSNGIQIDISYNNGQTLPMTRTVYNGQCNACHNNDCYLEIGEPCFTTIEL